MFVAEGKRVDFLVLSEHNFACANIALPALYEVRPAYAAAIEGWVRALVAFPCGRGSDAVKCQPISHER